MTHQSCGTFLDVQLIKRCAAELSRLSPDSEKEFLRIGDMLNALANICFTMTDEALALVSLANFSGKNDLSDTGEAGTSGIFAAVTGHVKQSIDTLLDGDVLLLELLLQVKQLRVPLHKLYRVGKTFRVLGISIKIESSRNRSEREGFLLLADEVADIAQLVQDNCRYCLDKTKVVEKKIAVSRQVLRNGDVSSGEGGARAIAAILESLEEMRHKSETLAAGIQQRAAAMSQGIGEVVMAMQFHDITRQQLENVAKGLMEACGKAEAMDGMAGQQEKAALEIYSILTVQAAHLNSVFEQVTSAKKQIDQGLGEAMRQARAQALDAKTLLQMEGGASVVMRLEREIDSLVESLSKALLTVKQAAEVSRDVYGNVSSIGEFISRIEGIAFDVKILAINAMVEAIKTEAGGNTLTVLAKELSNLSQETREGASVSIDLLQAIIEGTEKQLDFTTNLDRSSARVDEMIERARAYTASILSALQQINVHGKKMDDSSSMLTGKITKIIPGITFHRIMAEGIDRNWQIICEALDRLDQHYPHFLDNNAEVRHMLKALTQQYVMERERAIHAQVSGEMTDDALFCEDGIELFADAPSSTSDKGVRAEELGENVELF